MFTYESIVKNVKFDLEYFQFSQSIRNREIVKT